MPRVHEELGLLFYIYLLDHKPPHVHIKFGEYKLKVNIETLELISGYLPTKKRKVALRIVKEKQEFFKKEFNKYSK